MRTKPDKDLPQGTKIRKNERLEACITAEQKQLMEMAAFLRGQNLTEFMVSVLAEAAMQTFKDSQLVELTERDQFVFVEALLNPPAPPKQPKADVQGNDQRRIKRLLDLG